MSLSNILSKSCTAVCPTHKAVETTFRSAWAGSTSEQLSSRNFAGAFHRRGRRDADHPLPLREPEIARTRADRTVAGGGRIDQGHRAKIRDRLSRPASALEEPCVGGSPRSVHRWRKGERAALFCRS